MKGKWLMLCVLVVGLGAGGCRQDNGQEERLKREIRVLERENDELGEQLDKAREDSSRELVELRDEVRSLNRTIGTLQKKGGDYDSLAAEHERLKLRLAEPSAKGAEPKVVEGAVAGNPKRPVGPVGAGLLDADGKVRPAVADAVLLITGDQSVGTGFLVREGEAVFLYSAAHVISGNSRLTVTNSAGRKFTKFGTLEVAAASDLVRIRIEEEVEEALEIAPVTEPLAINTRIAALGNGGGGGVVAMEPGQIVGSSGSQVEIDAGVIQGNSGGPVLLVETAKVVGLVTHLTSGRSDIWAEGTRQAEVRRFACRLNVPFKWTVVPITAFLADGRNVASYDEFTLLGFAFARLDPGPYGLRYNAIGYGSRTPLEIIARNESVPLVKELVKFNSGLKSGKLRLGEVDLKKRIVSFMGSMKFQVEQGAGQLKPAELNPYHRALAERGISARKECIADLTAALERIR